MLVFIGPGKSDVLLGPKIYCTMNPAKILEQLKKLKEALKEILAEPDFDEEAPDYDSQS